MKNFNTLDFIMAWEGGELDDDETIEGFQQLIDQNLIGHLQGCYGRMAEHLIDQGLCVNNNE